MSDGMWNFRWWYSSGSAPSRLLRQQKRAIKQAGKKLEEIDKKYSTKFLKDDIQAESLLADLWETKVIMGTTIGCIIKTTEGQIILVRDRKWWWWFPKWWQEVWESELETLTRECHEELSIQKGILQNAEKLWEYDGYSKNHQINKHYIRYICKSLNQDVKLHSQDASIIDIGKFDISEVMTILDYDHMKQFWSENYETIKTF